MKVIGLTLLALILLGAKPDVGCSPSLVVAPSPSVVGQEITIHGYCLSPNRDLYWDMYNGIGFWSHSRSASDGTATFVWPFYIGPRAGPITSTGVGTYLIRVSYRYSPFRSVAQVSHEVLP